MQAIDYLFIHLFIEPCNEYNDDVIEWKKARKDLKERFVAGKSQEA